MKQSTAVAIIVFMFVGAAAFENIENKTIKRHQNMRDVKSERMQVFENCMDRNEYDYTDALCTLCFDSALAIIPYSKLEIKQFKKDYRAYIKWAKTKAIEPDSEEEFIYKY
jgi:guanylate kinase